MSAHADHATAFRRLHTQGVLRLATRKVVVQGG